jgi:two-component system chemotaxis sensor kinase CheA
MDDFIEQFLIECRELVEQATDDLLALEERPEDRERLDSAFRAFHTLKGSAAIVEFDVMTAALHAAEEVLSALRSSGAAITPVLVGDCLACLDQVVQWLDEMEASGETPTGGQAAADAIIARFETGGVAPQASEALWAASSPPVLPLEAHNLIEAQLAFLADPTADQTEGRAASAARVAINVLHGLDRTDEAGELERAVARDPAALPGMLRSLLTGAIEFEPAALAPARDAAEPAARGLRVDIERIDALVSLSGELGVARNALAHAADLAAAGADPKALAILLKDQHAVLGRLVDDLQHAVLNIRVLPLRHVFQRIPRLVREMVVALGKPARLITEGDATEADKAVVESLFEPLLHVMRNALDHGIETPEARAAAGKPPSATLRLSASREGDRVVVVVEDDGAGVNVERVRQVAAERGVASPDKLAAMNEQEVVDLIFAPGFSTAGEITNLSGRGVGMDAVRNAIERLGGRVTVESRAGHGTTVRFILPFTVMMTRVMTVEAGGQMFGVPMEAVVETARLELDSITAIGAARAFVLRDRTIPLIDLAPTLGRAEATKPRECLHVVVAAVGGQIGGLEVDRLGEPMEVMLKPLDGLLAGAPGVAGATLMGDGRVLIVLDLPSLLT